MTGNFGASAARLAGLAARALGWRPQEFWDATPAELASALTDPAAETAPLSRAEIETLLERDSHG